MIWMTLFASSRRMFWGGLHALSCTGKVRKGIKREVNLKRSPRPVSKIREASRTIIFGSWWSEFQDGAFNTNTMWVSVIIPSTAAWKGCRIVTGQNKGKWAAPDTNILGLWRWKRREEGVMIWSSRWLRTITVATQWDCRSFTEWDQRTELILYFLCACTSQRKRMAGPSVCTDMWLLDIIIATQRVSLSSAWHNEGAVLVVGISQIYVCQGDIVVCWCGTLKNAKNWRTPLDEGSDRATCSLVKTGSVKRCDGYLFQWFSNDHYHM